MPGGKNSTSAPLKQTEPFVYESCNTELQPSKMTKTDCSQDLRVACRIYGRILRAALRAVGVHGNVW